MFLESGCTCLNQFSEADSGAGEEQMQDHQADESQ